MHAGFAITLARAQLRCRRNRRGRTVPDTRWRVNLSLSIPQ